MRSVTDICPIWGQYLYENSSTVMERFTFKFVQISGILQSRLPVSFSPRRPLLNWTNYQIPWVLSRDEKSIRLQCCWRFFIISKEWNLYWNKKGNWAMCSMVSQWLPKAPLTNHKMKLWSYSILIGPVIHYLAIRYWIIFSREQFYPSLWQMPRNRHGQWSTWKRLLSNLQDTKYCNQTNDLSLCTCP